MLTEETLDFQYAYDLGIPRALSDRESAVIHYFLLAEALDGGESSQALYWLGRYLADRDCDLAVYYLERHLEEWGSRPQDTRDRIEKLRSKGCEGGMEGHE